MSVCENFIRWKLVRATLFYLNLCMPDYFCKVKCIIDELIVNFETAVLIVSNMIFVLIDRLRDLKQLGECTVFHSLAVAINR